MTGRETEKLSNTPGVYSWSPEGRGVRVRLSLDAVDRMLQEIMRGFGSVPKRGAEVGGILLGRVESQTPLAVDVDDFAAVPIEYRRGPSYLMSDQDERLFAETLAQLRSTGEAGRQPVGFFRSNTREIFELSADDRKLAEVYFPEPSALILIVRPYGTRVSTAGFYYRENGGFPGGVPVLDFPFRRKELAPGEEEPPVAAYAPAARERSYRPFVVDAPEISPKAVEQAPAYEPAAENASASSHVPAFAANAEARASSGKRQWGWIPVSLLFLLLGLGLGYWAGRVLRPETAGVTADPYALSLSVSKSADNLHVRWDRQAPAVHNAKRGLLVIEDGNYQKTVDLDPAQLQNGSVVYRHFSKDVKFRLEVFPKDRSSISETLNWKP